MKPYLRPYALMLGASFLVRANDLDGIGGMIVDIIVLNAAVFAGVLFERAEGAKV